MGSESQDKESEKIEQAYQPSTRFHTLQESKVELPECVARSRFGVPSQRSERRLAKLVGLIARRGHERVLQQQTGNIGPVWYKKLAHGRRRGRGRGRGR